MKKMPPVPPASRSPKGPPTDAHPSAEPPMTERHVKELQEKGDLENLEQNTRNQGNPQSR